LTAALDALDPVTARASSTQATDPRVRAGAAVDGDPATTWIAKAGDLRPTLTVQLPQPQRITGVRLQTAADAPVSRPQRVRVQAGGQSWTGALPDSGVIEFDQPVRSKSIRVTVLQSTVRLSADAVTNVGQELPTGISELQPIGEGELPAPASSLQVGCAAGLVLLVDGHSVPLRASVPVSAALSGEPVLAVPCGDDRIRLAAGPHRLRLPATSVVAPASITATANGVSPLAAPPETGLTAMVRADSGTSRWIEVHAAQAAYLVVRENANAGWHASLNGRRLQAVMLDGWQQGYLIPAGSVGLVRLDFTPQRSFGAGLVVGLLAVLLLLGMCWWPDTARRDPAAPAGVLSGGLTAGLIALAGFALLGLAGLLLAVGLVGAQLAADRIVVGRRSASPPRWPTRLRWLPPVALVLVGVLAAYFPPGSAHSVSESALGQLLAGVAVLATAATAIGSTRLTGRPSRRIRRSMPNQDTAATPVAATAVSRNSSPK
jgi:arabinofuranan 3-O-arabinosyltransferase